MSFSPFYKDFQGDGETVSCVEACRAAQSPNSPPHWRRCHFWACSCQSTSHVLSTLWYSWVSSFLDSRRTEGSQTLGRLVASSECLPVWNTKSSANPLDWSLRGRFGRPPLHTLLSICALPLKSHSLEFISGDLVVSVNWLLSPCIHLYGFLRHHLRRILKTKFSSIWQHSEQMKYKTYQRKKNASLIFRSASTSCTNLVPPARPSIQKKI